MNPNVTISHLQVGQMADRFDSVGQDIDRAPSPAVINIRLEAIEVLASSIVDQVWSLTQKTECRTQGNIDLTSEVQRYEADRIRAALTRTGGRQRRAAALLGIKPTTLHAKMKRYGLGLPDEK